MGELNGYNEIIDGEAYGKKFKNAEKEKKINILAKRWSDLNDNIRSGGNSSGNIKERDFLRDKIISEVFLLYKNSINSANRKYNYKTDIIWVGKNEVLIDDFYKVLFTSVNENSKSCYDAGKNDNYMAYLKKLINWRKNNCKTDKIETISIDEISEYEEETGNLIIDTKEIADRYQKAKKNRAIELLVLFMRLYEIKIRNNAKKGRKLSKTWIFFRMIYTFDIVNAIEAIKKYNIDPAKLCRKNRNSNENITPEELEIYCEINEEFAYFKKNNYEIHRNIRLVLVEILKEGREEDFKDMLDIIRRCPREGVKFEKRQEYIKEGLIKDKEYSKTKVSRATVGRYVDLYRKAIKEGIASGQLYY